MCRFTKFGAVLFILAVSAEPSDAGGVILPETMSIGCQVNDTKASDDLEICRLFAEQLVAVYPDWERRESDGDHAAELLVSRLSARQINARLNWQGKKGRHQGDELGAARAGADFDEAFLRHFLDQLIAATPAP